MLSCWLFFFNYILLCKMLFKSINIKYGINSYDFLVILKIDNVVFIW